MGLKTLLSGLKIRGRINAGFGVMILLLAILAISNFVALIHVSSSFDEATEISGEAILVSELNADMAKAQLNAREFTMTRDPEDAKEAYEFIRQLHEGVDSAKLKVIDPNRREIVDRIGSSVASYKEGLDELVELYRKRDAIVSEQLDVLGPKVREGLTMINNTAAQDGDYETANDAATAHVNFLVARLYVSKFLLNNDFADADHALDELHGIEDALARLQKSVSNPRRREVLNTVLPLVENYEAATKELVQLIERRNELRSKTLDANGTQISQWAADAKNSAVDAEKVVTQSAQGEITIAEIVAVTIGVVAIAAGVIGAWLIGRSLAGPVLTLTSKMGELAQGKNDIVIDEMSRSDEIGAMATALDIFRKSAIEREEMAAREREATQQRVERSRHIDGLVTAFDNKVRESLGAVAAAANELDATAQQMITVAQHTTQCAVSSKDASGETAKNVQTVAAAAEELSASIGEIQRQISATSEASQDATMRAQEADEKIRSLDSLAQEVGEVVQLINEIADQTNLLALNATIEAARAGDAGKGFAVVASEVKNLANQTARATQEIAQKISTIQGATSGVVSSIGAITDIIYRVNEAATSVASAIKQQSASTSEISASVQSAAQGTRQVVDNIEQVNGAAGETTSAASQVKSAAGELAVNSSELSREVETFLSEIRTA